MQMIDWGERRINLFREDGLKYEECILITRADQWRALLPHTIKIHYPSRSVSEEAEKRKRFTSEETAIRDIYDVFLNYLQRFGNFIMTDLVSLKDLKPYLHYWLESIAQGDLDKDEDSIEDLLWRHALLCYINFYNYTTVINLFYEFGFDISPNGEILKKLERKLADESYYEKQLEVVSERQPYLNANIKLISELKRTIQP
jgi:hypothetical protein